MPQPENEVLCIGEQPLTIDDVVKVARHRAPIALHPNAIAKMQRSRAYVEQLLQSKEAVYGLTTGFGKFSSTYISSEDAKHLQLNLIRSHACGVGPPFPEETARAMMLLRISALALGYSGVRHETVQTMADMLNKDVIPVIPEQGSVGASGDLAPLSHLSLVLIGEGEAWHRGERMPGGQAMQAAGIAPVGLAAKEGLALINGTQAMTAVGALACRDAEDLTLWADAAAALTCEALLGVRDAFASATHDIRPHAGQRQAARNIRKLTEDSALMTSQGEIRIQDAYSLRCTPQVHGASRDAIGYAAEKIRIEINSATDNPLIFAEDGRVISGGNFHGQPIALPMDFLAIAAAELASISERRVERLVNPHLNAGLPPFLTKRGGLQSGFMVAQYTAASLVSENKSLAHPASVDSIPTSGNQEDHVSMGTIAARKARRIIDNAYYTVAIELLCAAQAVDFRDPKKLGKGSRQLYADIRERIPFYGQDRPLSPEIEAIVHWMKEPGSMSKISEITTSP